MTSDTKTKILDAAEKLFAEQGFAATSLRSITAEAGVNLAAVNYHFQSKESLVAAVIERRVEPLNRCRLEMLDAAEQRAGVGKLPLEQVVDAFVSPVIRGFAGTPFIMLLGRLYTEPGDALRKQIAMHMATVIHRFREAFQRSLPAVCEIDMVWSVHFSIGAIAHTLAARPMVHVIGGKRCDVEDFEGIRCRLIAYICGGLRAFAKTRTQ